MTSDDENAARWAAEAAEEEADNLRKAEPPPALSRDEFLAWRAPRVVESGPVRLDNPLWHWLVRTRWSAYQANKRFVGPSPFDTGPMWCFDRFGMSMTTLPDGRVVHIGGEHEDGYDPDFFIYNDVTVVAPDGGIAIHGYARDVFAPTDFHTATLVDDSIFVIGCLGYPEQGVVGTTPVYRLDTTTMRIERCAIEGDAPGWMWKHTARLADDGRSIVISGGLRWVDDDYANQENVDTWSLDTQTMRWTLLGAPDWQRWTMRRVDRKPNRLWDVRQASPHRDLPMLSLTAHWRHGDVPDFAALDALYRPDADSPAPVEREYNLFHTTIDGVTVRFKEDRSFVEAIVEGRLPDDRLHHLQRHTLATLERLDASAWEIERPRGG